MSDTNTEPMTDEEFERYAYYGSESDPSVAYLAAEGRRARTSEASLRSRVEELETWTHEMVEWCDRNDWGSVPKRIEAKARALLSPRPEVEPCGLRRSEHTKGHREGVEPPEPTAPSWEERQAPPGELPASDSAEAPKGAPSSGEVTPIRPTWPGESTTGDAAPSGEMCQCGHPRFSDGCLKSSHAMFTPAPTPEAVGTMLEDEDGAPFPDKVQRAFRTALAAANAELAALREDNASLRAENSRTHVRWEGEYATLQVKLAEAERERDAASNRLAIARTRHANAEQRIKEAENAAREAWATIQAEQLVGRFDKTDKAWMERVRGLLNGILTRPAEKETTK